MKELTPIQLEMATHIINMLKRRSEQTKTDNVYFNPKEYVDFCGKNGVNHHKARSFIKQLHLSGHLKREQVHGKAYKYTPNNESKPMMKLVKKVVKVIPVKPKRTEKKVNSELTKKETEVCRYLIKLVSKRNDSIFKAKDIVEQLKRFGITDVNSRYYIKGLTKKGILTKQSFGVYEVSVKLLKRLDKIPVKQVKETSPEIRQAAKETAKCVKITYGEKQIMNTVKALQDEVDDLHTTLRGIHAFLIELSSSLSEKSQAQLTLQNLFKKKSIPPTQRIKG